MHFQLTDDAHRRETWDANLLRFTLRREPSCTRVRERSAVKRRFTELYLARQVGLEPSPIRLTAIEQPH
jgi:hypothetical protein